MIRIYLVLFLFIWEKNFTGKNQKIKLCKEGILVKLNIDYIPIFEGSELFSESKERVQAIFTLF